MSNIHSQNNSDFALFNLGFRPFFLVAGFFAIISMLIWLLVYTTGYQLPIQTIPAVMWHAHEMIFAYSMAVIAGFLLTAAKNWTGMQTIYGKPLILLVAIWIAARVLLFAGMVMPAAIFDLLFNFALMLAVLHPVKMAKQWRQKGILLILLLFFIANLLFYLGVFNIVDNGVFVGIYAGLYLIIGLISIMARRVFPMFMERGVDAQVHLKNYQFVDKVYIPVFLLFMLCELFFTQTLLVAILALALFILSSIRMFGWFTAAMWAKPLVWGLYVSMCGITLGFLLHFCSYAFGISKFLAIHAYALGGIASVSLAMMARVAFGHTGRNLHQPPRLLGLAFSCMLVATFVRVIVPLFLSQYYLHLLIVSQVLWIVAFTIFIVIYTPILLRPRPDGKFG
ncbi:MAG: NnrS family protein [Proteobacteria bacterium]|nr:NnrS family protein [Pseudomonadota bacterium]